MFQCSRNRLHCSLVLLLILATTTSTSHQHSSQELYQLAEAYPHLTNLYSLGQSTEGRDLAVLQISRNAGHSRECLVPMVKLVGNTRGDETRSSYLLTRLARHLVQEFDAGNKRVKDLLENTDIHIMPSANPDGEDSQNGQIVDLANDFPNLDQLGRTRTELLKDRKPETRALMRWILDNPFVLSVNVQEASRKAGQSAPNGHLHDDIDSFDRSLRRILDHSKHMSQSRPLSRSHWQTGQSGMQDFNYLYSNTMEVRHELMSGGQQDRAGHNEEDDLIEWNANRDSLLAYLETAHKGLKGFVLDRNNDLATGARIMVRSSDAADAAKPVYATCNCGEFWRVLAPGRYQVSAWGNDNYRSDWQNVEIRDGRALRVDFVLDQWDVLAREDWSRASLAPNLNSHHHGLLFPSPEKFRASLGRAADECACFRATEPPATTVVVTTPKPPEFICPPVGGADRVVNEYTFTAGQGEIVVKSPNFPSNYPNGPYTCIWKITHEDPTKRMMVTVPAADFNVKESNDCAKDSLALMKIDANKSVKVWCGTRTRDKTFQSLENVIKFRFITNEAGSRKGFRLFVDEVVV